MRHSFFRGVRIIEPIASTLVVEDDINILNLLSAYLESAGHCVVTASTGCAGLELATGADFDMCILDVMLPGISGTDIAAAMRAVGDQTPVLFLTALGNEADILRGFSVGADDYTGGVRMMADTVISLEEVRAQMAKRVVIQVADKERVDRLLAELPAIVKEHAGGRCPVTVAYQGTHADAELLLGNAWRVKPNADLLTRLSRLCGKDKVAIEY